MSVATHAAVAASGARVLGAAALHPRSTFSTDTRTLVPGDTYVALRGANFDGHAFTAQALARGAAALVVDDASVVPDGVAALVVADTTRAYLAFGGVARTASAARIAAITGSTGKTTTKTFLAQLLARLQSGRVVATPANENNEIGVAKLLLALPGETAFAVVEFGARHYGDIEPLARATRPDVAVLTNVGEAHLEIMGSPQRLAETKFAIFSTGAAPVLSARDAVSRERAASLGREPVWFSWDDGARAGVPAPDGTRPLSLSGTALTIGAAVFPCRVAVPGAHNLANAAAAAAAAVALGFAGADVARALEAIALPPGRYERIDVGSFAVIYDAYNASASGMLATLASFAREPAARRIAVLGSMAELGPDAAALHASVGAAAAAAGLAALLVGGDFADDLARGAREAGLPAERVVTVASNAAAVDWLRANARPGDAVLLKASRRYKLEEIVDGLRGARA